MGSERRDCAEMPVVRPPARYYRVARARRRGRVPLSIEGTTYYTTAEAAELLGVEPGAIRDAIARGALEYRTVAPRRNMVPEPALDEYRRKRLGRRGRPKGSPNRAKASPAAEAPPTASEGRDA